MADVILDSRYQMQLYDHANKRIFSSVPNGAFNIGSTLNNDGDTQIDDSELDLIGVVNASFLGGEAFGGTARIPIVYPLNNPFVDPVPYRIINENEIEAAFVSGTKVLRLPRDRDEQPILADRLSFDPSDVNESLAWAGIFGLDHLSKPQQELAIEVVNGVWGDDWSSYCSLPWEHYENDKWRAILSEWHQPLWRDATFYCPTDEDCTEAENYSGCLPILEIEIDDVSHSVIFTFCSVCRTVSVETQSC